MRWNDARLPVHPHARSRGIAIVMVFAALTALFLISMPFVRSMHQARESARNYRAWLEAKQDAYSARALAYSWLRTAHTLAQADAARAGDPMIARDPANGALVPLNSPDYDIPAEFAAQQAIGLMMMAGGDEDSQPAPILDVTSGRGRLWTVRVEDEQGKINVDTATPWLLGNLLGGSVTLNEIQETDTAIQIEDGSRLDPANSFVWMDGELIYYERCQLGANGTAMLTGCIRGMGSEGNTPTPDLTDPAAWGLPWQPSVSDFEYRVPQRHLAGTPVVPGSAYKATHYRCEPVLQLWAAQSMGQPQPPLTIPPAMLLWFKDIDSIRLMADYQKFDGGSSETIEPELWTDLRRYLTIYSTSQLNLSFVRPHVLTRTVGVQPTTTMPSLGQQQQITVAENTGINPGSILRLRRDGDPNVGEPPAIIEYVMAVAVNGNQVVIDRMPRHRFRQNETIVEVLDRHPVNINTAPEEVILACLMGLRINGTDSVSWREARAVADEILNRLRSINGPQPFVDDEDFRDFISQNYENWGLSSADAQAIILNATANHDPRLLSPTAPFCYRSYDTYTVEAVGTRTTEPVTGGPGIPRASYAIRDIVTIGAPHLAGLFDQRDMAEMLDERARGFGNGMVIRPRGNFRGRLLGRVELPVKPNTRRNRRQQRNNNNAPDVFFQDFPDLGQTFRGQPFTISAMPAGQSQGGRNLGAPGTSGRMDLRAGFLGFWINLDQIQGATIFDISEATYSNRFSLVHDGSNLILRMADAGLDEAFAELVFPANVNRRNAFRNGNWYHFLATWKGTPFAQLVQGEHIPMRMGMLIDGMAATPRNRTPGETMYTEIVNGSRVPRSTRLAADLRTGGGMIQPNSNNSIWHEITVEDASRCPQPRRLPDGRIVPGVVEISGEAIEYTVIRGNTLTGTLVDVQVEVPPGSGNFQTFQQVVGFSRGARGTAQRNHFRDVPVHPFGYSCFLEARPEAPLLPATSGLNQQQCGVNTDSGGTVNPDDDSLYADPVRFGPLAGLPSADGEIKVPVGATDDFPDRGYLLLRGNAITGYQDDGTGLLEPVPDPANPPQLPVGWEIVSYSGVSRVDTPHPKDSNLTYHAFTGVSRNAIPLVDGTKPAVPGGGWHFANDGSLRIYLISWSTTSTANYAMPTAPTQQCYVQVRNSLEIIGYNQVASGGQYFIYNPPVLDSFNGRAAWRGQLGTAIRPANGAPEPMLPVFWVVGKNAYRFPVGLGDAVTMISGRNSTKCNTTTSNNQLRVHWVRSENNNPRGQWVTLNDHVPNAYDPALQGTRMLKFPSGELPVDLPPTITFGGRSGAGSGGNGQVDELEWQGLGAGNFRLVRAVDASEGRIQVNAVSNALNREVGLVRVDDELIAYRGVQERQRQLPNGQVVTEYFLTQCERGFLGTQARQHDPNTLYLNVANARVAKLAGGLPQNQGGLFGIQAENPGFPLEEVGYVLAGTNAFQMELVGYRRQRNRFIVSDYRPGGAGLFRGSFGTPILGHGGNTILVGLPYRYIDRYHDPERRGNNPPGRVTLNSPEQFTVGGAFSAPQARWLRVHWQIKNDAKLRRLEGNHIEIHLFVKPSTVASWEDPGVRKFVFRHNDNIGSPDSVLEDPHGAVGGAMLQQMDVLTLTGQPDDEVVGMVADGVEWRVAFSFTNDAYLNDSWKWTPEFDGIYFEYEQGGVIYQTREIPR